MAIFTLTKQRYIGKIASLFRSDFRCLPISIILPFKMTT